MSLSDEAIKAGEEALAAYFEGDYEPGVIEEAGREPEAPIDASGERPRDPSTGQFVSTKDEALFPTDSTEEAIPAPVGTEPEAESTEEAEAAAEDEGAPPLEDVADDVYELEVDDPELMALIDQKYGGDVLKALQGLKESQSFIGKQSEEIGELRQLRQEFEQMQQYLLQQQQGASVDWDEAIDNDAEQAAINAFELGNMQAFGQAIDAVASESPFRASVMMQAFSQLASAEPEPQVTTLETEVQALQARIPDLQQTLPAIQEELKSRPALQQALETGDPRVMTDALETAYTLAKSRTSQSDTSTATKKLILKAKAQADAAIADAAVVGASTVPQEAPPKNPNEVLESLLEDIFGEHVPVV